MGLGLDGRTWGDGDGRDRGWGRGEMGAGEMGTREMGSRGRQGVGEERLEK